LSGLQYEEPPGANRIESVVPSSSDPSRLYVTTGDGTLYVGAGKRRMKWRKLAERPPGRLVASVGRRDVLYAEWNALFRSTNGGTSWKRLTCGLLVSDIAVSPSQPSTIYLAAGMDEFGSQGGGGIYRTTDGGRTWKRFTKFVRMHPDSDQRGVELVAVDPESSRHLYAGREFGGIDYSRDGGDHWQFSRIASVEPGSDGPTLTTIAFGGPRRVMWASSRVDGLFVGDARTLRWRYRGFRDWSVDTVVPSQRISGLVYVAAGKLCTINETRAECAKKDAGGPVLRTVDGGRHWQRLRGLPTGLARLTLQPLDDSLYAWDGRTLLRSTDHGTSWTPISPLLQR
jgi:photosystem II stability/assembly factor-like uncharacterized protein